MHKSRIFDLEDPLLVVVSNQLLATQWRATLAAAHRLARPTAWSGGEVLTLEQWIQRRWEASGADRLLLSRVQVEALWRRIVGRDEATPERVDALARRVAACWRIRHLERLTLADFVRSEYRASVDRWHDEFVKVLERHEWIDTMLALDGCSGKTRDSAGLILDLVESPAVVDRIQPLMQRSAERCHDARFGVTDEGAVPAVITAPHWDAELSLASAWLSRVFSENPRARAALVVPKLASRRAEVEGAMRRIAGSPRVAVLGDAARVAPALSAALTGLDVVQGEAHFGSLSRWLRSPFFSHKINELAHNSRLEVELRERPDAALGLARWTVSQPALLTGIAQAAPHLHGRLQAARSLLLQAGPSTKTASQWGRLWSRLLVALGWPGLPQGSSEAEEGWRRCLERFESLTAIVGSMDRETARRELERIAHSPRAVVVPREPVVVVLERLQDLGPGYDAVWVCGMSAELGMQAGSSAPFLELRYTAPAAPNTHLADALAAAKRRAPQVILSYAREEDGELVEPHALLRGLPPFVLPLSSSVARPTGSRVLLEEPDDPPPPIIDAHQGLSDPVRTLRLQARCPLLAFCQVRLDALPVSRVQLGLSSRQRGVVLHRLIELAHRELRGQQASAATVVRSRLRQLAQHALKEAYPELASQMRHLYALECRALVGATVALLSSEQDRPGAWEGSAEIDCELELGAFRLRMRLDRVEPLEDGQVAVIDYKSGRGPTPRDWLSDRLVEPQLPLYAIATKAAAAVVIEIGPDAVRYTGFWAPADRFPGRPTPLPEDRDWPAQLELWRRQLLTLIEEYVSGDVRVFGTTSTELAAYATLGRLYERPAFAASSAVLHAR